MAFLQKHALFALVASTGAAQAISFAQNVSSPAAACSFFRQHYPNITYVTNETAYTDINEAYWSAAAWLGPACIFAPTSADLMSVAVKTLAELNTPFAIKGGGHMAIPGYANINSSGVLLSSSNLNQIELSADNSSVAVGPGNRWGDVMDYLESYGLSVVGGRMSVVGVPGLLLGGGISNFGNEYGWASSNIDAYTCVLANGDIVVANATNEYADLFWALRGGGNSFCLVTNFQMRTLEVPVMTAGQRSYGSGDEVAKQFLDSVYQMAVAEKPDVKGAVTPIVRAGSSLNATTYNTMMFYNGNNTTPDFFANFSAPVLTPEDDTYGVVSGMGAAATAMSEGVDQILGLREGWWVLSITADREAMQIIHDTYLEMAQQHLANVTTWITGLAYNIVSKDFVVAGITNGGDPMGLDPTKAPYFWIEESLTWDGEENDAIVQAFYEAVNANITTQLEGRDVLAPFVYMNDANKAQDVYAGYPTSSVMLLKMIREKYDPDMVFTNLMPGGYKVANA